MVAQPQTRESVPAPVPDPAEGRRAKRRRELHQRVLDTAAELFSRDGYDATTVERIAAEADIVPATFFNHFPSKEDVLREVGQEVFVRFHRLVEEQLAREVTTVERLRGFAARSGELVHRAPDMTRRVLMAVLRSSRPGESGAELAALEADFAALLRRGCEAGDLPADLDVPLVSEILVSAIIGAMSHWINDSSYPLQRRLGEILSLLAARLLDAAAGGATTTAATTKRNRSPRSSGNKTAATPAARNRNPRTRPSGPKERP